MKIYKKYPQTIKTIGWSLAGFIVSYPLLKIERFSLFGYPLFVSSILMLLLSFKVFIREKNKK
jgi:hypothetical protein